MDVLHRQTLEGAHTRAHTHTCTGETMGLGLRHLHLLSTHLRIHSHTYTQQGRVERLTSAVDLNP